MVKKIEISQHAKYNCYFCGKVRKRPDFVRVKQDPLHFVALIFTESFEENVCGHLEVQKVSKNNRGRGVVAKVSSKALSTHELCMYT